MNLMMIDCDYYYYDDEIDDADDADADADDCDYDDVWCLMSLDDD